MTLCRFFINSSSDGFFSTGPTHLHTVQVNSCRRWLFWDRWSRRLKYVLKVFWRWSKWVRLSCGGGEHSAFLKRQLKFRCESCMMFKSMLFVSLIGIQLQNENRFAWILFYMHVALIRPFFKETVAVIGCMNPKESPSNTAVCRTQNHFTHPALCLHSFSGWRGVAGALSDEQCQPIVQD